MSLTSNYLYSENRSHILSLTQIPPTHTQFNADVGAVDIDGNLSVDHAKDDRITRILVHYMGKHGMKFTYHDVDYHDVFSHCDRVE